MIFPYETQYKCFYYLAIRTKNVQELVLYALLNQSCDSVYHAAMLDLHTAAELDLSEINNLVDELTKEHRNWMS